MTTAKKNKETYGNFERKDRYYMLKGDKEPVAYMLKSKGIRWYDPDKEHEREVMYTSNIHNTPFVDEFKEKEPRAKHIIFEDGKLMVPKEDYVLQWILSFLHPGNGTVFVEQDVAKEAQEKLLEMDFEFEAESAARKADLNIAKAILRTDIGSRVDNMTSGEIKHDLIVLSKRNPGLFLQLIEDENLEIRNNAVIAVESNLISLDENTGTFSWKETGRKIYTAPINVNPYDALTKWLKSDEGMDVYTVIEKHVSQ